MPKSLSRGPARLLALALALGAPVVGVTPAHAAVGDGAPTAPSVYANGGPDSIYVAWSPSQPGTDTVDEEETGDETTGDETTGGVDPATFAQQSGVEEGQPAEEGSTGDEPLEPLAPNAIDHYDVALHDDSGDGPVATDVVDAGEDLETQFAELDEGYYAVTVTAVDAEGDRSEVGSGHAEVYGYFQPDAPMIERAGQVSGEGVDGGDGRVEVTYEEGDDRGFEVERFEVVLLDWDWIFLGGPIVVQDRGAMARGAMGIWSPETRYSRTIAVEPGTGSATFDDVPAGGYAAYVQAVYQDAEGAEQYSAGLWDFRRVEVVEVPGKAQDVTATATGGSSAQVTWTAPVAKDGVTIAGYRVGISGPQGAGYEDVPADATSYDATGLEPGEYRFSVMAMRSEDLGGDRVDAAPVTIARAISPTTPPVTPATPVTPVTPVTPATPATPAALTAPKVSTTGEALQAGEKATIGGTATPGDVLQLQRRLVTSSGGRSADGFTSAGRTVADQAGRYGFTRRFNRTVEVRVANLTTGAVSPTTVVRVQKDVTLKAKRVAKRTFRLSGTVSPVGAGQVVTVLVDRGEGFAQVGRAVTGAKGGWSLRHRFADGGRTVVKVVSAASDTNTAGSRTRTLRVR